MSTKLTLATGSKAGIEEPLKHGYYMIGRDQECQIRPKSHSVSRRHCLLHHSSHGLRVFDLASANGTIVNDQRLEPNQWVWLHTGDQLRCGKLVFQISVEVNDEKSGPPVTSASLSAEDDPPAIENRGWENFDIASFLEAEDEAERQQRLASLRNHARGDKTDAASRRSEATSSKACEVTSIDLVKGDKEAQAVLEQARERARQKGESKSDSEEEISTRARRIAAIRAKIESERAQSERADAIKRALGHKPQRVKDTLPGSTSSGKTSSPSKSSPRKTPKSHVPAEPGQTKPLNLYVAVLVATCTICFCLYSAYQVSVGTPTRPPMEEID